METLGFDGEVGPGMVRLGGMKESEIESPNSILFIRIIAIHGRLRVQMNWAFPQLPILDQELS